MRGAMHMCEDCGVRTELTYYDATDAYLCDNCISNRAEAAYERLIEDFHDGGAIWPDLKRDQEAARKLK